MAPKIKNLIGKRYGRLVVIELDTNYIKGRGVKWICKCDCGNIRSVNGGHLKNGSTVSCGCYHFEMMQGSNHFMKDPIIRARHLKAVQSAESREKLRISLSRPEVKEKVSGENSPSKRPDVRIKMSISRSGSKHWHWLGGTSRDKYCEKWTPELRRRIRSFFNYECILCGKSQEENGRNLDCHHVEYNKQACCDGKEVHFAALCHSCHAKMCSKRIDWKNILCRIIDEIYDGKSYYTKEEYLEYKQSGGE